MKMSNIKMGKKQTGYSLLELILVLLIISVIAGFVVSKAAGVSEGQKQSQLRDYHIEMASTISNYYSPNSIFTGLTTAVAVDGKLVPAALRRGSGATASIAFGAAAATIGVDPTRTDLFFIAYDRLPNETCAVFVQSLSEKALRIEISAAGGGSYTKVKDLVPTTGSPIAFNPSLLATQCAAASPTYAVRFTQN